MNAINTRCDNIREQILESVDGKFNEKICEITENIESKINDVNEKMTDKIKTQVKEQYVEIESKCINKINEHNNDIEIKIMEVENVCKQSMQESMGAVSYTHLDVYKRQTSMF